MFPSCYISTTEGLLSPALWYSVGNVNRLLSTFSQEKTLPWLWKAFLKGYMKSTAHWMLLGCFGSKALLPYFGIEQMLTLSLVQKTKSHWSVDVPVVEAPKSILQEFAIF